MKQAELLFVGVLLAIVAVGIVLVDTVLPARDVEATSDATGRFLSSGWYCPSPNPAEDLQASMLTANVGNGPIGLRRLAIGGARQSEAVQANLAEGFSAVASMSDFNLADATGLVDAFGGNSSTDLIVLAEGEGAATSRCSDQPADRWLFATGSTARGENHSLLVANPFEEEAVIQVRLLTPDQEFVPARLMDLVIPPESQVSIPLVEFVVETPSFGMDVTATQGRVVVSHYSQITNRGGAKGIALDIGQRQPSAEWTFAGGVTPENGEESLVVINPGSSEALVGVVLMTDGERTAPPALSEVPVPAGRQITMNIAEHLPEGTSHGISLSSTNGEPVVAERRTTGEISSSSGYDSTFGVASTALRWVVAAGSPTGGTASLSMVNPGDAGTAVRISLLGPTGPTSPEELDSVQVEAGRKVTIDLSPFLAGGAVTAIVESMGVPIAVEATTSAAGGYADVMHTTGRVMR